jgi:NhaP-type Na+/H+ or K+/H+ antiporter
MTGIVMIRQETHLIRNRLLLILGISGVLIGFLGARYIRWGDDSGWMLGGAQKLCWLALIIVAYGSAHLVGGNEFSAAFVLVLSRVVSRAFERWNLLANSRKSKMPC